MDSEVARSRRVILRGELGEYAVDAFSERVGWPRLSESEADIEAWIPRQVTWEIDSATTLHYMEDLISDTAYLMVIGNDQGVVHSAVGKVENELEVWSIDELIENVETGESAEDIALAVLRLGMGSPLKYSNRVFRCIENALKSDSLKVQEGAVWSITYEAWPAFRVPLRELLDSSPEGEFTQTVRHLLNELDEGDDS
ncbi:hypothetical protein [Streptomyces sp. NPDC050428]|uniref:hypothetical protein n=1 Tax=Streptomyces sp. NPDC050428 TaxID=3155757 RepID=UPI003423F2C7